MVDEKACIVDEKASVVHKRLVKLVRSKCSQ